MFSLLKIRCHLHVSSYSFGNRIDLFKHKVDTYWNMLLCEEKEATLVMDFKMKLEYYSLTNLSSEGINGFWDLSADLELSYLCILCIQCYPCSELSTTYF